VVVPACMKMAKKELIDYMGTVILAFQAYRAGEADAAVVDLVRQSDAQYESFRAELKAINKCTPFCFR
jgi:ABC-type amino acid transport substrate-binding protein